MLQSYQYYFELGGGFSSESHAVSASHFTLWQLPSQTPNQMMSYVFITSNGKVIVVDGGNRGDAPYLQGFLAALGNQVQNWFISHSHLDHFDALTAILESPGDLRIHAIYGSLPEESWVAKHESTHLKSLQAFRQALQKSGRRVIELAVGQELEIDGLRVEILGTKNLEITANALNNSSVVMRVSDTTKSVLFTGDLGVDGGRKLLNRCSRTRLRADYVQMAHHGQNGVDLDFYRVVRPSACLWPTPLWLWENDSGNGKDSGPWQTLTVRNWMQELNVRAHYVSAFGLQRVD